MAQANANVKKFSKNEQTAAKVVDRILELIESGASLPWVKPWSTERNTITVVDGVKTITVYPHAWNRKGVEYKGVNCYLPAGEYITFNQCKEEGGSVKKGAKGFPVVYWNFYNKKITHDDGSETEEVIPFLKYYTVFNVADCDGIKQKHTPAPVTMEIKCTHKEIVDTANFDRNAAAEAVIADYIANAGNNFHVIDDEISDRAFYSPARDYVQVPEFAQFESAEEYYSTLFHELAHSTGHKTRLNRFTGKAANAAFGSEEYSREELVAEATAASVLNALGLEVANTFRNSAAYIKSWSSHIKNDPMMFVTAMTRAQAAFDMLVGIKTEPETAEE